MKKQLTLELLQPNHDSASSVRELRCSHGPRDVAVFDLRIEVGANHPLRQLAECVIKSHGGGPQFELLAILLALLEKRS